MAAIEPEDRAAAETEALLTGAGQRDFVVEFRVRRGGCIPDDPLIWVRAHGRPIYTDDEPTPFVASLFDVSELKEVQAELNRLAAHDVLTGLPTRRLLEDRLEVTRARRLRSGHGVAVPFCDLDGFKAVNDSLGHAAGDEHLVAVASRIRSVVRPSDTTARFGGDEFVIVLDDISSPDAAADVAGRIIAAIAETHRAERRSDPCRREHRDRVRPGRAVRGSAEPRRCGHVRRQAAGQGPLDHELKRSTRDKGTRARRTRRDPMVRRFLPCENGIAQSQMGRRTTSLALRESPDVRGVR